MMDMNKIAQRISTLRKEKGFSQEALAEVLHVTPQAVSKWENGKALPDTATLPLLAKTLQCSIDSILMPQELHILAAVYTDGVASLDLTQFLNGLISGNKLEIPVTEPMIPHSIASRRVKYLVVKYQNPSGIFFTYRKKGDFLSVDVNSAGYQERPGELKYLAAVYGNEGVHLDVMKKMEHYQYFQWNSFEANHELFPSPPENDGPDYLALVYLNEHGIQVISCSEGERLCLNQSRTELYREENRVDSVIIENIRSLGFGQGMDCSWAGALLAALEIIGEKTTYETVMGVSGACWRIAFSGTLWDYSSVDGLVAYDYATPGYRAFGYSPIWADRVAKKDRQTERQNVINSIKNGKPPIAINLRVAPEWGVITGFLEDGKRLLCRTYFDDEVFRQEFPTETEQLDFQAEMKKTHGYLYVDGWPFAIAHFSDKGAVPPATESFINSLKVKIDSMRIPENRGYKLGYTAFDAWRDGLLDEDWYRKADDETFTRRLSVNHFCMRALVDARKTASLYLNQSAGLFTGVSKDIILEMAGIYTEMSEKLAEFFKELPDDRTLKTSTPGKTWTAELRRKQADLLKWTAALETKGDDLAREILRKA
ncbi:MAG TPA: helix-turn-helix transcriptional regulator [Bacillota bacterium]|nr:helix-turn-helix transcriptional regulator [Bacillota bacterium]